MYGAIDTGLKPPAVKEFPTVEMANGVAPGVSARRAGPSFSIHGTSCLTHAVQQGGRMRVFVITRAYDRLRENPDTVLIDLPRKNR